MRRAAQSSSSRPRTRRKAAAAPAPADVASTAPATPAAHANSVEALLCLTVGVLLVVAALVPRSLKQLFLLGFGGALAYRGLEGEGGLRRNASRRS